MWVPGINSDFIVKLHGWGSGTWILGRYQMILMQPAQHCGGAPRLPIPTSWKVSTAKVPLYETWPHTTITSVVYIFFPMATWSLSANQDKITDNKGPENNQAVSTEATIPHLCKDKSFPCTRWTAAGHPNGECQGMVIKGREVGGGKSPAVKQP